MRVARQNEQLTLTLNVFERRLLHHILTAILRNYRIKPEEIHPKVAAVWYSRRGCETARMSPEETSQWVESLYKDRRSRSERIGDWAAQLVAQTSGHSQLQIKTDEASDLMTVLNDHRLWLAARHDIGQTEMDLHSLEAMAKIKPTQQTALYEIHFLACIIEGILRALLQSGF